MATLRLFLTAAASAMAFSGATAMAAPAPEQAPASSPQENAQTDAPEGAAALNQQTLDAQKAAEDASPALSAEEQAKQNAVDFTTKLTRDAAAALTADGVPQDQRIKNFQKVLGEGLAVDLIGRFMLGEARTTMTEEQTAEYDKVFPEYITRLYAEQFEGVLGKDLEIVETRLTSRGDVLVRTQFERTKEQPITVDWRVRKLKSGDQKIIDIIVSGVSIMLVKREEFTSLIAAQGVDGLLSTLREKAQMGDPSVRTPAAQPATAPAADPEPKTDPAKTDSGKSE